MINLINPKDFDVLIIDDFPANSQDWIELNFDNSPLKPVWLQSSKKEIKAKINLNQSIEIKFFWFQTMLNRQTVQVIFNLHNPGTKLGIYNFYHLDKQDTVQNLLQINHFQANCKSFTLFKGVLEGQANARFVGKIFVDPNAHQTNAKLSNHTVMLSDDAKMDSKPELEIYCDDVKCTHEATIGTFDSKQNFYLQSRGLDQKTRNQILTEAFLEEVLDMIKKDFAVD